MKVSGFLLGGDDVKQQKRVQITAIQETTAEGFTQAMNLELEKRNEPKITYITSVPFTAYIEYTETVEIPESLKEKYELNPLYRIHARVFSTTFGKYLKNTVDTLDVCG